MKTKIINILLMILSFSLILCSNNNITTPKPVLPFDEKILDEEIIKFDKINDDVLIRKVTINSTYFELGYQIGLMGKEAGVYPKRRTSKNQKINEKIIEMYKEIYPQFLEKVSGLAKVYDLTIDDIDLVFIEGDYFLDITWILFDYEKYYRNKFLNSTTGCSVVSYYVEGDIENKNIIGRNLDFSYYLPGFSVIANVDGVYKTMYNTAWALNFWVMDGINEKGLFIADATVDDPPKYKDYGYRKYPDKPAISSFHMVRIVLDLCSNVDEAINLIKKMNVWFSDDFAHFLIADAEGNSVIIEFDKDGKLIPIYRTKNYLHITNTSLQADVNIVKKRCWRYKLADKLLSENEITSIGDIFKIMMEIRLQSKLFKTLWISLYDLTKKEMDVRFIEEDFSVKHGFKME